MISRKQTKKAKRVKRLKKSRNRWNQSAAKKANIDFDQRKVVKEGGAKK